MGLLGKTLKGRSTVAADTGPPKNARIREIIVAPENVEAEKENRVLKLSNFKKQMLSEEKINNINRKKLLTNWRNIMRIAKTGNLLLHAVYTILNFYFLSLNFLVKFHDSPLKKNSSLNSKSMPRPIRENSTPTRPSYKCLTRILRKLRTNITWPWETILFRLTDSSKSEQVEHPLWEQNSTEVARSCTTSSTTRPRKSRRLTIDN